MNFPHLDVCLKPFRFELPGYSKSAFPLLLLAILVLTPTADLWGQGRSGYTSSRTNANLRENIARERIHKLKTLQHKLSNLLFGSPPKTSGYRPTAYEQNHNQRNFDNAHYPTAHRAERIAATGTQGIPKQLHSQNRLVSHQQDQAFQEPFPQGPDYRGSQRWPEHDVDPRRPAPAQMHEYESPIKTRNLATQQTRNFHPQDSRMRQPVQNTVDGFSSDVAGQHSSYPPNTFPPNTLRDPVQPSQIQPGSSYYGSASQGPGHQNQNFGGHMRGGPPYQGQRFPVSQLTGTEKALRLEKEVTELEKRVEFLEKVNEQLRQSVNRYDNVSVQTTTKMNQVAQQLIEANESNQRLLQRIAFLESENQKIRMEAARVLDSIKHNLDDLLLRELKGSNGAGQLDFNR